ncbi:hypothetical protein Tco_1152676 [Tanacetum coccineum]
MPEMTQCFMTSCHLKERRHSVVRDNLTNKLTNEDIRNSESYKEYYAMTIGNFLPKTNARTRVFTRFPVALDYDSDDDISWKSSEDDQDEDTNEDDENAQDDNDDAKSRDDELKSQDDQDDGDEAQTESEDDGDDFIHSKAQPHDDETTHVQETNEDDTFDPIVHTPSHDQGNEENRDTNANLEGRDDVKADVVLPQSSSISYGFISNMLNLNQDTGVDVIFGHYAESYLLYSRRSHTPQIEKLVNEQLESEVLVRSSKEAKTSHAVAANLSELELKKILIDKMEANKSINMSDIQRQLYKALVDAYEADKILLDTYGDTVTIKRPRDGADDDQEPSAGTDRGSKRRSRGSTDVFEAPTHQEFETGVHDEQTEEEVHPLPDWFQQPKRLPSPDHAWNKSVPAVHESVQPWLSNLARRQDPRESFDELTDTTFDFSAFVMNRLNVKTLTPELLAGPTFELMKGTCKSLTELEYFCKEVYKATKEKLDWINPEGRQYPHDMRKPLPLVPNSQGRHVIPFHHFINNDLEYLRGGESSRKESACDVYLKRRIIAVTKVEIVEWQNYKHLDWITIRRDDDILYKFKEGDFHRLRIQDIEDMLLLLVQGKLTNLNVEERLAFNVSLRMFTRSVVIQRRVEDLQLGVESYQKKLNLTKPDTYRSNLRRRDAYTPYSDPRGFIYENKDKKNRLMRIDELHKFSDGTLDDVRTALNDRLKGIRMEYLPQTFWSQRDKANARAMIQAIDKRLKTRRIMRSLERFVGGRPYGGDLRLLQRTI